MKPKQILTIVLILAAGMYLTMNTETDPNQVTIKGDITNPKAELVTFSNQHTTYSTNAPRPSSYEIRKLLEVNL